MRTILLIFFVLAAGGICFSQTVPRNVTSSSGGNYTVPQKLISFTPGEPVTETFTADEFWRRGAENRQSIRIYTGQILFKYKKR